MYIKSPSILKNSIVDEIVFRNKSKLIIFDVWLNYVFCQPKTERWYNFWILGPQKHGHKFGQGPPSRPTVQSQPIRYSQPSPTIPVKFQPQNRVNPERTPSKVDFKCEFCQVTLNSLRQLDEHNLSPKHINTKYSIQKLVSTTSPTSKATASMNQNLTQNQLQTNPESSLPAKRPKFEFRGSSR